MATAAQMAEFRAANIALANEVEADLANFWRYVDLSKPERARNALLNFVPLLVQRYGDMAATLAADWFEELRFDAIEQGYLGRLATSTERSFTPRMARPDLTAVTAGVRYAAGSLFTDTPEDTLRQVQSTARFGILQAGRDTIRENTFTRGSGARGWGRVTRPGACRFCRALASRGGVYTERSARFAAHAPKCNCAAAPVWDPTAPEVDANAYVASRNTATMTPAQRERHRGQIKAWLEREFPGESDHDDRAGD